MTSFVAYLRVSTQRQGSAGLGVDAQRATVLQYALARGGTVVGEIVEVESGFRRKRPILVQSIALCRKERATLLIAKLDRLARILAAFAEHEREQISERTRNALAAAKQRSVVLGSHGRVLAQRHREQTAAHCAAAPGADA